MMNTISRQTVKDELKRLFSTYQSETKDAHDETDTFYWDSALDTIRDVAVALHIPLQELE